jgi:hypothetical protein
MGLDDLERRRQERQFLAAPCLRAPERNNARRGACGHRLFRRLHGPLLADDAATRSGRRS